MGIKNKFTALSVLSLAALACGSARAENVAMNTAQMQALDKITGQMKVIEVPVNGEASFGSFSVVVRSCQTTPPEETPENYAFVDIADTDRNGETFNIFKGWMVSSSPSLNSVEHPIYDVWLLKCHNTQVEQNKLLSAAKLLERDKLERHKDSDLSKEAKIAIELQEEQARKDEQAKAAEEEFKRRQEEEKENKARQIALEREINQTQQQTAEDNAPVDEGYDSDGPVSLLNMGQRTAPREPQDLQMEQPIAVEDKVGSAASESATIAENKNEAKVEAQPAMDLTGGSVILEDTHHETMPQDLNLPDDIDEIVPQKASKTEE